MFLNKCTDSCYCCYQYHTIEIFLAWGIFFRILLWSHCLKFISDSASRLSCKVIRYVGFEGVWGLTLFECFQRWKQYKGRRFSSGYQNRVEYPYMIMKTQLILMSITACVLVSLLEDLIIYWLALWDIGHAWMAFILTSKSHARSIRMEKFSRML